MVVIMMMWLQHDETHDSSTQRYTQTHFNDNKCWTECKNTWTTCHTCSTLGLEGDPFIDKPVSQVPKLLHGVILATLFMPGAQIVYSVKQLAYGLEKPRNLGSVLSRSSFLRSPKPPQQHWDHPASCSTVSEAVSPELKRPERQVDHWPLSGTQIKDELAYARIYCYVAGLTL
jgi:hypothetical protein